MITVRAGKGDRDRVTMVPAGIKADLLARRSPRPKGARHGFLRSPSTRKSGMAVEGHGRGPWPFDVRGMPG
jgi:hypothetical protein